jgi:hypothetical protein
MISQTQNPNVSIILEKVYSERRDHMPGLGDRPFGRPSSQTQTLDVSDILEKTWFCCGSAICSGSVTCCGPVTLRLVVALGSMTCYGSATCIAL